MHPAGGIVILSEAKNLLPTSSGGVAEWSMAAVLKTVERQRSGGSNPSASASKRLLRRRFSRRLRDYHPFSPSPLRVGPPGDMPIPLRFIGCLPVVASLLPPGTAADAAFGPSGLKSHPIKGCRRAQPDEIPEAAEDSPPHRRYRSTGMAG